MMTSTPMRTPRRDGSASASPGREKVRLDTLREPDTMQCAYRSRRFNGAPDGQTCNISQQESPTRLDTLRKPDTIPCAYRSRRFNGAPNEQIRIYIRMSSIEGTINVWVDPDLPVHPSTSSTATLDGSAVKRMTDDNARANPHEPQSQSPTPSGTSKIIPPSQTGSMATGSTPPRAVVEAGSLQEIIEQCTGVAVAKQHLRIGSVRLDLNCEAHVPEGSTLRQLSIIHGTTISMCETPLEVHHHLKRQAQFNSSETPWIMPRWQYSPKPNLVGQFPDGGYLTSKSVFFQKIDADVPKQPPHGYDACDTIRGRSTFLKPRRR